MTTTVEVEIDLDEISNYELVNEIVERMKANAKRGRKLTEEQRKEIRDQFSFLAEALRISFCNSIVASTIDDERKMEHLSKVFNQYNSFEFEMCLPNKH